MSKKAIILSGGGAKGAWGVGVVKGLMENGQVYNTAIGTSTGSLMAPFILSNNIPGLEIGYTGVNQGNIFSRNPFNKKNGKLKFFFVLGRLLCGRRTLGESKKLRKKIDELVTDDMMKIIQSQNKLLGATVVNFNKGISEVKTNKDFDADQMRDWIWASANNPLFMSHYDHKEKDGSIQTYADGGVTNYANVQYILDNMTNDISEIDVIFHNTREVIREGYKIKSKLLTRLMRVMDMLNAEVFKNDLENAILTTQQLKNDVELTIYFMGDQDIKQITGGSYNSLLFDKERMKKGLEKGYKDLMDGTIDSEKCIIKCDTGRLFTQKQLGNFT